MKYCRIGRPCLCETGQKSSIFTLNKIRTRIIANKAASYILALGVAWLMMIAEEGGCWSSWSLNDTQDLSI